MNCLKLIQMIKQKEELYMSAHSKYSDTESKEEVWKEISKELNAPVEICKNRWNNIRCAFVRALRLRECPKILPNIPRKPYKYEKELQFLIPHLQPKGKSVDIIKHLQQELEQETSSCNNNSNIEQDNETQFTFCEVSNYSDIDNDDIDIKHEAIDINIKQENIELSINGDEQDDRRSAYSDTIITSNRGRKRKCYSNNDEPIKIREIMIPYYPELTNSDMEDLHKDEEEKGEGESENDNTNEREERRIVRNQTPKQYTPSSNTLNNTPIIQSKQQNIRNVHNLNTKKQTYDDKNCAGSISSSDYLESNREQNDAIDLLFSSFAATVKQFPPNLRYTVKTKIFNLIAEAEMQFILQQRND